MPRVSVGSRLGRYEVRSKLGAGGMAEVFLAEDTQLGRRVALKLLPPEAAADEHARRRLLREARAAAALDHAHICSVFEVGEADGLLFIAMQYIEGWTLAERLRRGSMDLAETLSIAVQIVDALNEAHTRGVLHRDIKPANIMLTSRGEAKVMDFGLAKPTAADAPSSGDAATQSLLSSPGAVIGTIPYMSPEQVRGEALDPRSDLFSVGVVLYEMVCGRRPFDDSSEAATSAAILTREPPPPARFAQHVPAELERILLKLLRKKPDERYQTAKDLLIDLRALREEHAFQARLERATAPAPRPEGRPAPSSTSTSPTADTVSAAAPAGADAPGAQGSSPGRSRAGRPRARHAMLVALGLTAIGGALWAGLRWRDAAPAAARPVPVTTFQGLEVDPAISPDGKWVAFAWDGGSGDNFDIFVQSIDGSSPMQLTKDAASEHAPAWSPDGLRIAFVRVLEGKREIVVLPKLGGGEKRLFEAAPELRNWMTWGSAYGLSWTPDGKHLVFGDRSGPASNWAIYLYSFDDGERRQLTHPPANLSDSQPVVSPNGRYLAFVRVNRDPNAVIRNVMLQKLDQLHVSGEPTPVTSGLRVIGFDWAADSRHIIYDSGNRAPGLWRAAVAGGAPEPVLPNILALRPKVARSSAGVVYQNMRIEPNIWELPLPSSPSREPSGDKTFPVVAWTSFDSDMQFSPDGTRIAFASDRSGHSEIWVSNRDGSQANKLTSFAGGGRVGRVGSPAWSADGKLIAFDTQGTATDNWNLHSVAADGGGPAKPLTSDAFNNTRPSWSIDRQWIYFASDRTGDWQIWKVPSSGGSAHRVTFGGGREPVASWDGRRVYYAKEDIQGIWAVPVEGGQEVQVVIRGRPLNFDVGESGIFLLNGSAKPQATVEMFRFATQQVEVVARLPAGVQPRGYFSVTRDGSSILYQRFDQYHSDIEMLRDVR